MPGEKPLGAKERTNNKLNPHMAEPSKQKTDVSFVQYKIYKTGHLKKLFTKYLKQFYTVPLGKRLMNILRA